MILTSLCLISSGVRSNELDELIRSSAAIVQQIDRGIMMTGAAVTYANNGTGVSDGTLAGSAHISLQQLQDYNAALTATRSYKVYGSAQDVLEEQSTRELELLESAVQTFTGVVVEMAAVQEVSERASSVTTLEEEVAVQNFVVENEGTLALTQDSVETYNQSLDDIETHANNSAAYLAVAGSPEAVAFLEQAAEEKGARITDATLTFSQATQSVDVAWNVNATSQVYLNGTDNFNIDIYKTNEEILTAGSESEFYLIGPTAKGFDCFYYNICDEEGNTP